MVAAGGNHSYLNIRVRSHHKLRTDMLSHVQALHTDMFSYVQVRCGHERARGKRRGCGSLSSLALASLSLSLVHPIIESVEMGHRWGHFILLSLGVSGAVQHIGAAPQNLWLSGTDASSDPILWASCALWGNSVRPFAWDSLLQ